MTLLLDTHVLLWWLDGSTRLGGSARENLTARDEPLLFSIASPFELAVKVSTGRMRLDLPRALLTFQSAGFRELNASASHYAALAGLPLLHRDPFDRLIIAQAIVEGATIMTNDAVISRYPVRTIGCD